MESQYNVPIIPQNLRKNETIVQIAEALQHLTNVTDDIFNRVNNRLEQNSKSLKNVSERMDIVSSKVNMLKGTKKATQVFSSCKYPGSECIRDYESIFSDLSQNNIEIERHKVKVTNLTSLHEPLDKLQFYHVKVPENSKVKLDGLGDIPADIHCVNDLLLYNTGKNLYDNFVITDSLKGPKYFKSGDNSETTDIGAAPPSISENTSISRSSTQNYFYSPKIGEVPALDVPLDLPDLPGIADDLRYENEVGPGIAPSESIIQHFDNLPALEETTIIEDIKEIETPEIIIPPPNVIHDTPVVKEVLPTEPVNVKIAKEEPDISEKPAVKTEKSVEKPVVSTLPPITDARASLMEAIRNAGGSKKLKTAEKSENVKSNKHATGDLMADLHNKLLMRRKGISGTQQTERENSGNLDSTLSKISAMIPPPIAKTDIETSTDEDWE